MSGRNDPRGTTLFVGGPPESGKSDLMWNCYTRHCPRILTCEVVEETAKRDLANWKVFRVFGRDELTDTMREITVDNIERFHIIASLERDEYEWLFRVLVPVLKSKETRSYARARGGMVVACSELADMAPRGLSDKSRVKAAYLRYRHSWLSIHGATQHAPDADPCTRLGVERAVFLRISDDLGLDAVKRAASSALAGVVAELPQYHALTCLKREGKAYVTDEHYDLYRILNYRGALLWERPSSAAHSSAASFPAGLDDSRLTVTTLPVSSRPARESGISPRLS